jgi:hypothetical protein
MTLTPEQLEAVKMWIERGADLAEIQKRLKEEFSLGLTYLETRLLADDLKLQLQEPETPPEPQEPLQDSSPAEPTATPGRLSLTIDQVTRPGALVSGRVQFSDGEKGEWFLDQTGRLGLNPNTPGYKPSQKDVVDFQSELERLARDQGLGM